MEDFIKNHNGINVVSGGRNHDIDELAERVAKRVVQMLVDHQRQYLRNPGQLLQEIDLGKVLDLATRLKDLFGSSDEPRTIKRRPR